MSTAPPLSPPEQAQARKLAWSAMGTFVREGRRIEPGEIGVRPAGPLVDRRGCFVTWRRDGQLRGCIGSIEATQPLWQDLVDRAIHAATEDPRFPPVTPAEIDALTMEISVLSPLEEVDGPAGIRIGEQGILLREAYRQAVFLPQVAVEQRWDLETTLGHLAVKAGLGPEGWRRGCRFWVFTAQVF